MTRKLTHEEFIEKFNKQNKHAQDIEILGTYINNRTKIKCKCKIDGYEWEAKPANLLRGTGCPKYRNTTKLTHEEFMEKFNKKNKYAQDIEVLEHYKNNRTKLKCRCKKCGHEWEATPNNLLKGSGCPKCADNINLTHEEFLNRFYKKNKHANDIEILETYINRKTKILCKCKKCGYEWKALPCSLLQGTGCVKCIGLARPTQEEFINKLQQINPDIEILGHYKNSKTKIKCRCTLDGYEWETCPQDLLRGKGCPECGGTKKLTHEEFLKRLYEVNPDIEILGTYTGSKIKIECRCKKCGHEWKTTPNTLLSGHGCSKCNTSNGEKRIAQYLDNMGIDYIYNMCHFKDLVGTGGGLLRPDFIIPSMKMWIEFDGQQHFRPVDFTSAMSEQQLQEKFEYVQKNDQIKNQYAKDNNWTLIRIPFTEYDNIEQILDSYLGKKVLEVG